MGTWVRTASVYVDHVESAEEADNAVGDVNRLFNGEGVHIRLPDEDSEYKWEEVSDG